MQKRCEGCGRTYFPKTGTQRYCAKTCSGRPAPASHRTLSPWAGARQCDRCPTWFVPVTKNHRFCSIECRNSVRKEIDRQLYTSTHKRTRASVAPQVATGRVSCARCGLLISPGQPWDLGHVDGDSTRYAGPEHRACNRGAPSRNLDARLAGSSPSRNW